MSDAVTGAMNPYYDEGGITIYHGDCREVTAWLAADVLVTDPPYGISWSSHGVSRTSRSDRIKEDFNGDRRPKASIVNDHTTESRDDALRMWATKPAFVFGSLMLPPPLGTKHVAVYIKPLDSGALTALGRLRRDLEAIYVLGSSPEWSHQVTRRFLMSERTKPPTTMRSSAFRTRERVAGSPYGVAARAGHPHAKPIDVLSDLISLHSGVVADPFAGSGSMLVAAKLLGRRAIGIEIEERYCEIAAKRLAQGVFDFATGGGGDGSPAPAPLTVTDPDSKGAPHE